MLHLIVVVWFDISYLHALVTGSQPRFPPQHQDIERLEESTIPVIVKTEDTVARVLLKGKDPLGPQLFDFLGVPGVMTEKSLAN